MWNLIMNNYRDLREKIHQILLDFLNYEFPVCQGGEFDYEYMECSTDAILNIIKDQGGSI